MTARDHRLLDEIDAELGRRLRGRTLTPEVALAAFLRCYRRIIEVTAPSKKETE